MGRQEAKFYETPVIRSQDREGPEHSSGASRRIETRGLVQRLSPVVNAELYAGFLDSSKIIRVAGYERAG